ncbi:pyrroline-5-carboxylate reductase [Candidatus Francisella endociliophora]|uniref:Pyrroline-5-carboxylate reductase n=1 Tax=Candidatus Francisella endociliophora TaxID=653937 RepID=A0A097EQX2_9GAMM|nr:pyrroline-5-carboxylate reductase [Francisella sp. FSC1006]AIT09966.1 pyrroline-5-carboxylate reductase [Francisella sp. FSC1006]
MQISFIGGGNMAAAMIAGMVAHGYDSKSILVFDRNKEKKNALVEKYGICVSDSISSTVKGADILILAIKPQNMVELINDIKALVNKDQIIVTVAAGIETQAYEKLFAKEISFVRTIPNTPSSLGYGATGIYFNNNVSDDRKNKIIDIMKTMGEVAVVNDEREIDVIAAIASSGPAYYFQFMEHMIEAAVNNGLDKSKAEKLVMQTCLGAAKMAQNSNEDISTLRKNVTSKKGITYEALNTFESLGLDSIVNNAIQANIKRAKELSKEFSEAIDKSSF